MDFVKNIGNKMKINIETFNDWAIKDKDLDMQAGHLKPVDYMLDLIYKETDILNKKFSFLDVGCGNGWVVRKISELKNCILAEGVDGAPEMINKAKGHDAQNHYYLEDIEHWNPDKKYDIIFSMEVFYYFKDPKKIINNLVHYLNEDGILIIGIDHYLENTPSLNWDKEYNISTNTLSIKDWKSFFVDGGLNNLTEFQYGASKDWEGTLILLGNKKT